MIISQVSLQPFNRSVKKIQITESECVISIEVKSPLLLFSFCHSLHEESAEYILQYIKENTWSHIQCNLSQLLVRVWIVAQLDRHSDTVGWNSHDVYCTVSNYALYSYLQLYTEEYIGQTSFQNIIRKSLQFMGNIFVHYTYRKSWWLFLLFLFSCSCYSWDTFQNVSIQLHTAGSRWLI